MLLKWRCGRFPAFAILDIPHPKNALYRVVMFSFVRLANDRHRTEKGELGGDERWIFQKHARGMPLADLLYLSQLSVLLEAIPSSWNATILSWRIKDFLQKSFSLLFLLFFFSWIFSCLRKRQSAFGGRTKFFGSSGFGVLSFWLDGKIQNAIFIAALRNAASTVFPDAAKTLLMFN